MNCMADHLLEAVAIGPDVPLGGFPVEVHSIFRSAINLQPCRGGNLITILSHQSSDYPQGVRLATDEDFTTRSLEPGFMGQFQEDGISLDRRESIAPLHISFSKAKWLPAEPLPFIQQRGDAWLAGIELLRMLQTQAGTDLRIQHLVDPASTQGFLGSRLAQVALELGESVQSGALDSARMAISRLVGLGSGLTPSGDDFLCGFITAAHCRLRDKPNAIQFLRELKPSILDNLSKTNAISATFLRCAVEGKVCRALHNLALALQGGSHFSSAMVNLCAMGHSSGMDITTGFLFGLTIWE